MNKQKNKKIIVGISGGIDSAISLYLLKQKGWHPIGVFLELPKWKNKKTDPALKSAKSVCQKLNVPFRKINVKTEFKREVVDYFISEFKNTKTPNPCVICNRYLKFKQLFDFAKKHNIQFVATGHYAKTQHNPKTKKFELVRPKDKAKDQTYYLSLLPQKWLKNIIFPLENIIKKQVYKIANKLSLTLIVREKQSQDFCFVNQKSLPLFLKEKIGEKPGLIINTEGKKLGEHRGLHFYTIGQRKGINLPGGPYFVKGLDKKTNTLIVTRNKKELHRKELICKNVVWISGKEPKLPLKVKAKIRYCHQPATAAITKNLKLVVSRVEPSKACGERKLALSLPKGRTIYNLKFNKPQRAITPGQFCVFYLPAEVRHRRTQTGKENVCLGGGVIL